MVKIGMQAGRWAAERWTDILAGAVIGSVAAEVFTGRMTPAHGVAVALVALGLFAGGLRAALQQHREETLKVLEDVAALGKAAATRNVGLVIETGVVAVQDGCALDREIEGAAIEGEAKV